MALPGTVLPRLVNSSDSDADDDKKLPAALRKNSNSPADSDDSDDGGAWKRKVWVFLVLMFPNLRF